MTQKNNTEKTAVATANSPEVLEPEVQVMSKKGDKRKIIESRQYMGPIPPAEEFKRYGEVLPTAPERILCVFEQDSGHTREMQSTALKAEIQRDKRSQWMAFFLIACTIGLTTYSLHLDKDIAAALSALVGSFMVFKGVFSQPQNDQNDQNNQQKKSKSN